MTKKEKMEMQKLAKKVLFEKLGFAPSLENIILLESGNNGDIITYLCFRINGILSVDYQIYIDKIYMDRYDMCIVKSHDDDGTYHEDNTIWL